jgi:hypothetical protein
MAYLNVTPTSLKQGDVITCNYGGFTPNTSVWVQVIYGGGVYTTSDNFGMGSIAFALTSETPGSYTMVAEGGGDYATASFAVTADVSSGGVQVYGVRAINLVLGEPAQPAAWKQVDDLVVLTLYQVAAPPLETGWKQVAGIVVLTLYQGTPIPEGWVEVGRAIGYTLALGAPNPGGWVMVNTLTSGLTLKTVVPKPPTSNWAPLALGIAGAGLLVLVSQDEGKKVK